MKTVSSFYAIILILLALHVEAQIGDPAPDFTVMDTHGDTHRLYDYLDDGKTVVLDFFYTTCIPCQFYTPQVNLAYEKYGCNDAEVIFMGIDYNDTNAEVLAYDDEYGIMYPSISGIHGGGNNVVGEYGIFGFPTFYVIDSSRHIVQIIDPPTLQVFDFRFNQLGIQPMDCNTSSVVSPEEPGHMDVFPNPCRGSEINLVIQDAIRGWMTYDIINAIGHTVQRESYDITKDGVVRIDVDKLPRGVFTVHAYSEGHRRMYAARFAKI